MITFYGTRRKAVRVSGFRARLTTQSGRKILKNRRKKGRKLLSLKGKR